LGGQVVNLNIGIRIEDTFYWLLTINTGLHADAFPGIVGLTLRIEQFAAQGGTMYHMGPGDYFYKIHGANQKTACQDVLVCNPSSWKGRAYFAWMQHRQQQQLANP
jgi:CelD/BcsL family acetyltransferase involved in cellulose biosynthesis